MAATQMGPGYLVHVFVCEVELDLGEQPLEKVAVALALGQGRGRAGVDPHGRQPQEADDVQRQAERRPALRHQQLAHIQAPPAPRVQ